MSIKLYDDALLDKLKEWTKKVQGLHIYGPADTAQLFETIADETKDKNIKLPLISVTRPGGYTVLNPNKFVRTYDGITLEANDDTSLILNTIPININYSIDIYTRKFEEADLYARELIFNIINYPTLKITIPYNSVNRVHNSEMRLYPEIEDNSGVPEMHFKYGQFSRFTLNIYLDDAYLWSVREHNNVSIDEVFDIEIIQKLY